MLEPSSKKNFLQECANTYMFKYIFLGAGFKFSHIFRHVGTYVGLLLL